MKILKYGILGIATLTILWSPIQCHDLFTWILETTPAIVGLPLLSWFDRKYGVSPLLYILICIHSMVLAIGGHYTYAEVPIGHWFQEAYGLGRNHYDRLGHFLQGATPALIGYEVLSRNKIVASTKWLFAICVCIALAFSAFYELIEWWVAISTGESATAFLGSQGDVWDTQWDMFMALCGAMTAMTLKFRRR